MCADVVSKSTKPVPKAKVAPKPKTIPQKAPPSTQPQKPSIVLVLPLIRQAIDSLNASIDRRDVGETSILVETLKTFLTAYDFASAEKLKAEITQTLSSAAAIGDLKLSKAKRVAPKPGSYTPVKLDILAPNLTLKRGVTSGQNKQNLSITLDELRDELENEEFIASFTQSIRDLMNAKSTLYAEKKRFLEKEQESIAKKVKHLKNTGTTDQSIREMYPGFDNLKSHILDIGDLIEITRTKARNVTEMEVKENLIEALDDPEYGLSSISGRLDIKNGIAAQIYSFSKGYKTFLGNFNNIVITGSSGSGKTFIARILGFVFSKIGILAKNMVKIVSRSDLVGQYIGHTAPRTKSVLMETLEGILFIDEAYQLTEPVDARRGSRDFGGESITEIVNFLDKYIGLSIVIVAGYENLMTRDFLTFNEGMPRRFPYRYSLNAYTNFELTDILINTLRKILPDNIKIDNSTSNFIFTLVAKTRKEIPGVFENQAGDMLNLAASINKAVCGSFKVVWLNGKIKNNIPIILEGFDDFLHPKGVEMVFGSE